MWDESARQTRAMLAQWTATGAAVTTMADDTRLVALHVLSAAGLGLRQDFATGMRAAGAGHRMTYRDALMRVLRHIVLVVAAPEWLLLAPGAPGAWRGVVEAKREFRAYMAEMLARERAKYEGRDRDDAFVREVPNLMATLIRSSDAARSPRDRLSDDEIFGNLFLFNFAGHDTTANALAFALALLAIEPEMQEWVGEEVAGVFGAREVGEIKYEEVFPRLARCQAVLVSLCFFEFELGHVQLTRCDQERIDASVRTGSVLSSPRCFSPGYPSQHGGLDPRSCWRQRCHQQRSTTHVTRMVTRYRTPSQGIPSQAVDQDGQWRRSVGTARGHDVSTVGFWTSHVPWVEVRASRVCLGAQYYFSPASSEAGLGR